MFFIDRKSLHETLKSPGDLSGYGIKYECVFKLGDSDFNDKYVGTIGAIKPISTTSKTEQIAPYNCWVGVAFIDDNGRVVSRKFFVLNWNKLVKEKKLIRVKTNYLNDPSICVRSAGSLVAIY